MKFSHFLFFCCFLQGVVFGQQIKVIDQSTLQPLENVFIFSSDLTKSAATNSKGIADISNFTPGDDLNFQHPNYNNLVIGFNDLKKGILLIKLTERVIKINEVIISATKWKSQKDDVVNEVLSISPKEIAFNNPQTSADILDQSGQVFVQKSQLGGGSPMLRGFSANSVLLMMEGIRLNNAIFRSGNLQNAILIDPNMVESSEVIFGPGTSIYGSDALGGVMNFRLKDPVFRTEEDKLISGTGFGRFSSANLERTGHLHFNLAGKNIASLTSITFSGFDDLVTGSDRTSDFPDFGKRFNYVTRISGQDSVVANKNVNRQRFSGYDQVNILQKFKFRPNDFSDITYSFYFTTSSDIPRYDRLIVEENGQPASAEWYYGPQKFLANALKFNIYKPARLYEQASLTLSYQVVEESRNNRDFRLNDLRNRTEEVKIFTANLDFEKPLASQHQIYYGFEGYHNKVESTAFIKDITNETIRPTSTRYPDGGSIMWSVAPYISYDWKIKPNVDLQAGIRYNYVYLLSEFEDTTFFDFPFSEIKLSNHAINGNLGVIYLPNPSWRINGLFSSGFRSPNVDDAAKVFDSEPGNVIVPNPDLGPEFTYNFELGLFKKFGQRVQLEGVLFYTLLEDALVRRNFTFNGQDSIIYDGTLSRVQALVNVGSAYIWGYSLELRIDLTKNLGIISTLSQSDGEDTQDNIPLRHTTPLFGKTSLFFHTNKIRAEIFMRYNGQRKFEDLPPSEQNKTHLYTSDGSLAWSTLNVRASYQINETLQVNGGIENLFDTHYRPYSSGISAPGRNFIISARFKF